MPMQAQPYTRMRTYKLKCDVCTKTIFRQLATDTICDNCFTPDGSEDDRYSDGMAEQKIVSEINELLSKELDPSKPPKPCNNITNQNKKTVSMGYDCVVSCVKSALDWANLRPSESRKRYVDYMNECKRQIEEHINNLLTM